MGKIHQIISAWEEIDCHRLVGAPHVAMGKLPYVCLCMFTEKVLQKKNNYDG